MIMRQRRKLYIHLKSIADRSFSGFCHHFQARFWQGFSFLTLVFDLWGGELAQISGYIKLTGGKKNRIGILSVNNLSTDPPSLFVALLLDYNKKGLELSKPRYLPHHSLARRYGAASAPETEK